MGAGTGTGRGRERGRGRSGDGNRGGGERRSAGRARGRERGRDGNWHGSEDSSGDGNGYKDNGNGTEDRIGEGEKEAKKRKKPQNSCRRHAGNEGGWGGKRKTCRKERVGSVAANLDNLESNKEAGGRGDNVLRAQVRIVQAERVCPLCRVGSEVFVTSIIDAPFGGSMRVA